jgi:TatD DNase family protein
MDLVDSHCHLDLYERPMEVLKRAEAKRVVTVAVTELPSRFQRLALRLGSRRLVRPALGIHPLRASTVSPMELALFTELLDQTEYVGEIGLDKSHVGCDSFRAQMKVFEHLLQQPRIKRKVLTVHSRGAEAETIERLVAAEVTAILHWYSEVHRQCRVGRSLVLGQSRNAAVKERPAHHRDAATRARCDGDRRSSHEGEWTLL